MIEVGQNQIVYTTYSDFAKKVRRIVFPDGMSELLAQSVENYIWVALIKAQKYNDFLRSIQVSFHFAEQLDVHCGVARLVAPRGKINAVYAFTCDGQCSKQFYRHSTPQQLDCWREQNRCLWEHPLDTTLATTGSDLCYPPYSPMTKEDDAAFKRMPKLFAVDRAYRLYLAPRFPCGYILAVHWEGLRRTWAPTDVIPEDDDLVDWVAAEVQAEIALRQDRDGARYEALQIEADSKLADIAWWGNEERRVQARRDCLEGIDGGNLFDLFPPMTDDPIHGPFDAFLIDPDGGFVVDPESGGKIIAL